MADSYWYHGGEKIYVEINNRPSSQKKLPYYVEFEVLHFLIKNSKRTLSEPPESCPRTFLYPKYYFNIILP
jgi:hypothetical protein